MTQTNANKWNDEISFGDIEDNTPPVHTVPHVGDRAFNSPAEYEATLALGDKDAHYAPTGWDSVGTSNDDAPAPATTIPVILVSESFDAPVIVESAAALVQTERNILRDHGIPESEQLFADGTAFLAVGHKVLDDDMAHINALPPFSTGVEDLKAMIASECRQDLVGDLRKLRLNNDGLLAPMGNPDDFTPLSIEDNAWRQLAAKVGSQNLNLGLARRESPAPMRIRTRNKL